MIKYKYEIENSIIEVKTTDEIPEGISFELINYFEEIKKVFVPTSISRMKFIIQVYVTIGIKYEDIVLFIQNLTFDESQKYIILTRLRSATHFDRNSNDLQTIAALMQISEAQLDEIFIEGNKLQ